MMGQDTHQTVLCRKKGMDHFSAVGNPLRRDHVDFIRWHISTEYSVQGTEHPEKRRSFPCTPYSVHCTKLSFIYRLHFFVIGNNVFHAARHTQRLLGNM